MSQLPMVMHILPFINTVLGFKKKKNLIKISMLLWNFKVCAMITKQIPLLYRYSYLLLFCIKSLHLFSTWIYKNEFKN